MNIDLSNNDIQIQLDTNQNGISIEVPQNDIQVETPETDVELDNKNVYIELGAQRIETGGTQDHSELENLDYEHSGHTGFQPAGNYATNERVNQVEQEIPTIPENIVVDANYVHTDNNYTTAEKTKLSGIESGAEANVQANWNESDSSSDAYIQNKPTIPTVPTNVSAFTNDANYVSNTDYANGSTGGVFKTASNFATTVTSGGYLVSGAKTYNEYQNANVNMFVSKGTLDNVITGKGLVSNTDYANNSTGGVIKTASNYATTMTQNGELQATSLPYQTYQLYGNSAFVSKGTLENVIAGKNLVSDSNYVHTDNNFDDDYMNKLDCIDIEGSGESFLADDGSYYPISADIRIPEIKIKSISINGEKYLRLQFGAYSKAFEDYVRTNGISIHLLRYKYCCRREWNDAVIKHQEKKWIHPANNVEVNRPDRQCWGFACYQIFMDQQDYFDQLENAEYQIANNGMVQSEYRLNFTSFKKGFLDINVRDLMSCIVKKNGLVSADDVDMHIPYEGDGEPIKIMGTRVSHRRKRVRQPIKYVFAVPITTTGGTVKYQYGTSNEAILELLTLRESKAIEGYGGSNKLLPDIGYGVLIK